MQNVHRIGLVCLPRGAATVFGPKNGPSHVGKSVRCHFLLQCSNGNLEDFRNHPEAAKKKSSRGIIQLIAFLEETLKILRKNCVFQLPRSPRTRMSQRTSRGGPGHRPAEVLDKQPGIPARRPVGGRSGPGRHQRCPGSRESAYGVQGAPSELLAAITTGTSGENHHQVPAATVRLRSKAMPSQCQFTLTARASVN